MARDTKTTRLQGELAHRYAGSTPARKKPQPGRGSLTEDLAEIAEPEVEGEEGDQELAVEGEAPEVVAEPKKSLFELPRKEPIRPSLLGGGIEVTPPGAAVPASPATPTSGAQPQTPGKKSTTTRRG